MGAAAGWSFKSPSRRHVSNLDRIMPGAASDCDQTKTAGACYSVRGETLEARQVKSCVASHRSVKYALRTFSRNPTFTAVAVIALGLGVGARTLK